GGRDRRGRRRRWVGVGARAVRWSWRCAAPVRRVLGGEVCGVSWFVFSSWWLWSVRQVAIEPATAFASAPGTVFGRLIVVGVELFGPLRALNLGGAVAAADFGGSGAVFGGQCGVVVTGDVVESAGEIVPVGFEPVERDSTQLKSPGKAVAGHGDFRSWWWG